MQQACLRTSRDNYKYNVPSGRICKQLDLGTPVITPTYLVVAYTIVPIVIHTGPELVAGCIYESKKSLVFCESNCVDPSLLSQGSIYVFTLFQYVKWGLLESASLQICQSMMVLPDNLSSPNEKYDLSMKFL